MEKIPLEPPIQRPESRHHLPNIPDFRDVGVTVNAWANRKILKEGVLYRSAAIEQASPIDRKFLKDELGIRTILDLRRGSERSKAEAEAQALAQSQSSRETFDISSKITGIHYKKVNLIGRQTKKYLLQHISWTNWLRFSILYYILQDHMATKRIITRKLWENNGLNGFLINILDHGKPQVIKALRALTEPAKGTPILIHCAHGKDRTGLLITIILLVMNIPLDAISHDYCYSEQRLYEQHEINDKYTEDSGLKQGFVEELDTYIRRVYGGIDGYLSSGGFTAAEIRHLRNCLAA
ncbi:hypothetical protein M0657_005899 [Pyricularia oryzae]|nr:hypothetical protein M9X92_005256 [Pyricularia oryzae]KAI7921841.1 hypothetical protein M0657_005899 [Pyricularia oryzae]